MGQLHVLSLSSFTRASSPQKGPLWEGLRSLSWHCCEGLPQARQGRREHAAGAAVPGCTQRQHACVPEPPALSCSGGRVQPEKGAAAGAAGALHDARVPCGIQSHTTPVLPPPPRPQALRAAPRLETLYLTSTRPQWAANIDIAASLPALRRVWISPQNIRQSDKLEALEGQARAALVAGGPRVLTLGIKVPPPPSEADLHPWGWD